MKTEDKNRAKITKAALYIEENLSATLRASDIAKYAHLSHFHFQRLFCAYMGEPVSQYVTARRLEAAAIGLKNCSSVNLLQLSLDCGFQTHSAFSKAFKKQFGVSPTAFRNNPEVARKGVDLDRRFLISAPPNKSIEAVGVVNLLPFHFQFRQSYGTYEGQFFRQKGQNIGQQFSTLLAETTPPNLFLMSCFPNTPQNLNDNRVPIWFGGAFSDQTNSSWSKEWHCFGVGAWAVFEHLGDYRFLYQTWNRIYRNWLPQTDYVLRDDIPFEAYLSPTDASDRSRQLTRIHIPIKKA
ncbi:AraC-type DNA-binding protein [Ruegeria halocynthiae]|uniref:AraC-type DNA-binding protein n=1 Tax=Ruegeria halocynthiae TaxID=985054 RepID=A0A1H3ED48_9RHOB|nr:AraC family transcriptional regulator [Ruegeria halocynthiae]SDX76537.1 AraC-type DNA-binding protein [Ruegeria halocynthiae]